MSTKRQKNKHVLVDDKKYWKERHAARGDLRASGQKSVSLKSNEYIYKILDEQYLRLLNSIDLSGVTTVLDCGFGDGYFLKFYQQKFPGLQVFGVDISKHAKSKIEIVPQNRLYTSDLATFSPKRRFDIVHSFDVMYHILKTEDYTKSLRNIASLSNKYVILHERFLDNAPLISSKHVRLRRSEFTNQILNSKGFYLTDEIPTHFFAVRLLTYKLNKLIPSALYRVDRYIADRAHPSTQEFLASHSIRVYSKDGA